MTLELVKYEHSAYSENLVRSSSLIFPLVAVGAVAAFVACATDPPLVSATDVYLPYGEALVANPSYNENRGEEGYASPFALKAPIQHLQYSGPATAAVKIISAGGTQGSLRRVQPRISASSLYRQVAVKKDYLPYKARGRTRKSMTPRFITIHSTQNWSRGADAARHALAMKRGALGHLSWHYTVDEDRAVQHLPTNEQANHADYDGPGNRYSIGVEMCENIGNSRAQTLERTAKLAAWLMHRYDLPVSRVVPHYKWPRKGKKPENKNCPHFLMNNGRPGAKWEAFQGKVQGYYQDIVGR